jgi:cytidylate kinase
LNRRTKAKERMEQQRSWTGYGRDLDHQLVHRLVIQSSMSSESIEQYSAAISIRFLQQKLRMINQLPDHNEVEL